MFTFVYVDPFRERQPTVRDEPLTYLHDLSSLPIYCQSSKLLATAECIDILLDPELSPKVVCTRVPFDVDCNSGSEINHNAHIAHTCGEDKNSFP